MIETNTVTIALMTVTIIIGFLMYFISFKFLIHVLISVIGIFMVPIYYQFNPFMISIPEYQFFELVVNGLIYLLVSMVVNWVIE